MIDVLIIGAGPIGIACGLAAKKKGLSSIIIEKGTLVNSLYNYPVSMTFFSTSEKLEINENSNIDPSFLFLTDGCNFRNTELNAVLGLEQLKRLDHNIEMRRKNFECFMKHLDPKHFYVPYNDPGNSNFALPFICKNKEDMPKLKIIFKELGVEYRPIVSGNLLLHPFLKKWKDAVSVPNANIINDNGVYIGNSQFVTEDMIVKVFQAIKTIW